MIFLCWGSQSKLTGEIHKGDYTVLAMWLHCQVPGAVASLLEMKSVEGPKCSFGSCLHGHAPPPQTLSLLPFTVCPLENNLASLRLQVLICKMVLIAMTIFTTVLGTSVVCW